MNGIWIGFDPREAVAFEIARSSLQRWCRVPCPQVRGLFLSHLRMQGLYRREIEWRRGPLGDIMFDVISEASMSTEFAISRFLVPHLADYRGWHLFVDCDVLFRCNVSELFRLAQAHPEYAVMCVKHQHAPPPGLKMDGQKQTQYARKNWSSVMMFYAGHDSNRRLTVEAVNSMPGRDLHRFCWLEDHEIGELGPEWNWLVGHSDPAVEPKIVHFTDGIPTMRGYESVAYADEWYEEAFRIVNVPWHRQRLRDAT